MFADPGQGTSAWQSGITIVFSLMARLCTRSFLFNMHSPRLFNLVVTFWSILERLQRQQQDFPSSELIKAIVCAFCMQQKGKLTQGSSSPERKSKES